MDEPQLHHDEDEGPIGIFRSWSVLYGSVIVYTVALVVLLWIFTVAFDHSVG